MEPGVVPPPPPTTAGDVVCDISEVLRDIAAKVGEQADAALVGGFAQPLKLDTVPAASGAPAGASSGTGAPAPPATGLKAQRLEYVPWSEPATSSAAAAAAAAAPAGGFATTTVQAPPVPAGASSAAHGIKIETAGSGLGESGSRGPVKADDMTDDLIHEALQVEVTSESCHMIRLINTQLLKLLDEGVVKYVTGDQNSVWGFQVLEVKDPLRFNKAFRQVTPPPRGNKPLIRPTEVFMKTLRFCGVAARRGARGPQATDPDPRDFMYSYYYDYVASKKEHNRRKLCHNGYSREARETAETLKGNSLRGIKLPRVQPPGRQEAAQMRAEEKKARDEDREAARIFAGLMKKAHKEASKKPKKEGGEDGEDAKNDPVCVFCNM
eukprot:Tamp_18273.p1 GENE.Tamp_18273~~Tamp_18273.p1  ORF type:complete len:392 (+),score=94.63 Tamp_18273:34-1176(+)